MQAENQLTAVRSALGNMPRDEWQQVACDANLTIRTLYNMVNPNSKPGYDTVYAVYTALIGRVPKKGKKR